MGVGWKLLPNVDLEWVSAQSRWREYTPRLNHVIHVPRDIYLTIADPLEVCSSKIRPPRSFKPWSLR